MTQPQANNSSHTETPHLRVSNHICTTYAERTPFFHKSDVNSIPQRKAHSRHDVAAGAVQFQSRCVGGVASWENHPFQNGNRQLSGRTYLSSKKSGPREREFRSAISPSSQARARPSSFSPIRPAATRAARGVGFAEIARRLARSMPCSPISSRASTEGRAA